MTKLETKEFLQDTIDDAIRYLESFLEIEKGKSILDPETGEWIPNFTDFDEAEIALSLLKDRCILYDLDDEGNKVDVILISGDTPEKIYEDYVDHYGDKRDQWEKL